MSDAELTGEGPESPENSAADEINELDDATVVRPRAPEVEDATVVRSRASESDPDATVVRPLATGETSASAPEDAFAAGLFSEPPLTWPAPDVADDHSASGASGRAAGRSSARAGKDVRGEPIAEPDLAAASATGSAGPAVAAALAAKSPRQLPRVYGPRNVAADPAPDPDQPTTVTEHYARAQLPSIERREKRARLVTIAGYVVAVGISIAGLWFIATLAF